MNEKGTLTHWTVVSELNYILRQLYQSSQTHSKPFLSNVSFHTGTDTLQNQITTSSGTRSRSSTVCNDLSQQQKLFFKILYQLLRFFFFVPPPVRSETPGRSLWNCAAKFNSKLCKLALLHGEHSHSVECCVNFPAPLGRTYQIETSRKLPGTAVRRLQIWASNLAPSDHGVTIRMKWRTESWMIILAGTDQTLSSLYCTFSWKSAPS